MKMQGPLKESKKRASMEFQVKNEFTFEEEGDSNPFKKQKTLK